MSGTSADGVDVAYLESDGVTIKHVGPHQVIPYSEPFRDKLLTLISAKHGLEGPPDAAIEEMEVELTSLHAAAVTQFMLEQNLSFTEIDLVGFHGHTIHHDPSRGRTIQIGDGARLSSLLDLPVVCDFRSNDVQHGGQGAPLAPVYHAAIFSATAKPIAVLNIGGVANVTWIGHGADSLLSFDTGPGNALIDDWIRANGAGNYDDSGKNAASGCVDNAALELFCLEPYFSLPPPKSLDRNAFCLDPVQGLSLADGAATLAMFTVQSIELACNHFRVPPVQWIVCGGGRRNNFVMERLACKVSGDVTTTDALGWNGDAIEAQAFAFLAIRSALGLPISFPSTTGVSKALTGGRLYVPQKNKN